MPSDLSDDAAMEFQIYSSHHVSRRHLVGVASFLLKNVDRLDNGLIDLTIMPQTVFRVSDVIVQPARSSGDMTAIFSEEFVKIF